MASTDVLVVGGGPAGLAAAIAARQRGFDVTVADGAEPPIDKACGEGLLPPAVEAIRQLGVPIDSAGGLSLSGIRFLERGASVEAAFPAGPQLCEGRGRRTPTRSGFGLRRTALHRLLVEHAVRVGVSFLWRTPITGLHPEGVSNGNRVIRARWVIGADGSNSRIRSWTDLDHSWLRSQRFGFVRHFRIAPWTRYVEIYWHSGCQIYVTPVGREEVCVALLSRSARLRLNDALPKFPELAGRLQRSEAITSERGAVTATSVLKRVYRDRVALVGDASGSVDAISGDGLGQAFRQALALGGALQAGDLAAYQRAHRALARQSLLMTGLLLSLDKFPMLRHRALGALSSNPRIFRRLLAAHVGSVPAADVIRQAALPLAFRMLRSSG